MQTDLRMFSSPKTGAPSPDRGRLMTAQEIALEIFCGRTSPEWVRRTLPQKIRLGHSTVRWWESDVIEYIESRKNIEPPRPPQGAQE